MISAKSSVFTGIASLGSRLPATVEALPNARPTAVEAKQAAAPVPAPGGDGSASAMPFVPALIVEPDSVESEEEKAHRKAKDAYQRRLAAREGLDYTAGRSIDEKA